MDDLALALLIFITGLNSAGIMLFLVGLKMRRDRERHNASWLSRVVGAPVVIPGKEFLPRGHGSGSGPDRMVEVTLDGVHPARGGSNNRVHRGK